MKNTPNSTSNKYKKKIINNVMFLSFALLLLLGSIILYVNNKNTISFSYKEDSEIDYLVYLKENNHYEEDYLPKNMQYIASAIDYIDVNFIYNLKANDIFLYDYDYYITSHIKIYEKGNESNILFEKKEDLIEKKQFKKEENAGFRIKENLKIDYVKYNTLVRNFKSDFNLGGAESNLTLTLHVNIDGKYENVDDPIKSKSSTNLVIPLSEQTLNIKVTNTDIDNNEIVKQTTTLGEKAVIFYYAAIVLGVITLIIIINIIVITVKEKSKRSLYQRRIDKLLREYDRVIVEVKSSTIKADNTNFIMVKTFEELLDVSDRLEQPILHNEIKKGKRSQFIVRDVKDTYFYVVDSNNMDKSK